MSGALKVSQGDQKLDRKVPSQKVGKSDVEQKPLQKNTRLTATMRTRTTAAAALLALCIGMISIGSLWFVLDQQEKQIGKTYVDKSQNLSDALAAQFFERYGDVQAFALHPSIRNLDSGASSQILNDYAKLYGIYDLILLVDTNGRLVAANTTAPNGDQLNLKKINEMNFEKAEWFQSVMNGKTSDDESRGFRGTYFESVQVDPYLSVLYGKEKMTTSFSTAVKDIHGNIKGVLTTRASLAWIEAPFQETAKSLHSSGFVNAAIFLSSVDGKLLYSASAKPETSLNVQYPLLKTNLIELNSSAALALKNKTRGYIFGNEPVAGEDSISGFSKIDSVKFIPAINWAITILDARTEALSTVIHLRNIVFTVLTLTVSIGLFLIFLYIGKSSKVLESVSTDISGLSTSLEKVTQEISHSSAALSQSGNEQAAALQETAASLAEITSMVQSTSEHAVQSKGKSENSRRAALNGKSAVDDLAHTVNEIHQSNDQILKDVAASTAEFETVIHLIEEISNKARLINDIVFQTKLLSFNASVEAARAGEQGKGFAVVAEEVGALAQNSGKAASEITGILSSSLAKVKEIVSATQTRVTSATEENRKKIQEGLNRAKECGTLLETIVTSVDEVNRSLEEIANASTEQSKGVSEINQAISQLDNVTNMNSNQANKGLQQADKLKALAGGLRRSGFNLERLIKGIDTASARIAADNILRSPVHFEENGIGNGSNGAKKAVKNREAAKVVPLRREVASSSGAVVNRPSGAVSRGIPIQNRPESVRKEDDHSASSNAGPQSKLSKTYSKNTSPPPADDPRFEDL